jgi:hypothetical protein
MSKRFARGNRDRNEPLITEYLRRANVRYVLLPEGAGADLLLYLSPLMLVEVKNPDVRKSDRELTEIELEVQEHCKQYDIPYHVVCTPEEMAEIVNRWITQQGAKL